MKKKILHIIFNLGRGGAETMLVNVVKELPEFEHVILTLFPENDFGDELQCDRLICMNLRLRDLLVFPLVAGRMRKIIREVGPDLVHTHLYWPTVLARMATPVNIPLITTIHAFVRQLVDFKKWYLKTLYRYSYKLRPTTMVAVAKGALSEYYDFLQLKPGKNHVLYTFVDTRKFSPRKEVVPGNFLRMAAVGALRYQKNHAYLVYALKLLPGNKVNVDIYGDGPLRAELQNKIDASGVSIQLKGQVKNIAEKLKDYDVFVMPSFYEGFSLGVLEAMAMKIPLLLSDIPSFREQCGNTALYFDLNDPADLARKVEMIKEFPGEAIVRSEQAYQRVLDNFTLPRHVENLRRIYFEELGNDPK